MLAERVKEWNRLHETGRQEGEAMLVLRLLVSRFGTVDETIRERVRRADADTLLEWGERVLTANHIDDVMR